MSEQSTSYERIVIYAFLALAAVAWLGFGGLVFVGILHDVGA